MAEALVRLMRQCGHEDAISHKHPCQVAARPFSTPNLSDSAFLYLPAGKEANAASVCTKYPRPKRYTRRCTEQQLGGTGIGCEETARNVAAFLMVPRRQIPRHQI